jgi:hypothetical protein
MTEDKSKFIRILPDDFTISQLKKLRSVITDGLHNAASTQRKELINK